MLTALLAQADKIEFNKNVGEFSPLTGLTVPSIVSGFIRLTLVVATLSICNNYSRLIINLKQDPLRVFTAKKEE